MSIYHLSVKIISRSGGRDSTAAAAYRARDIIKDERTELTYDYSKKKADLMFEQIFVPAGCDWQPTRSELWNGVEAKNIRKDSQTAREFEIALPSELTQEKRQELLTDFVREVVERHKVGADVAVHNEKDGNKNFHAHIMFTTNFVDGNGIGGKNRDANKKEELEFLRERWATLANEKLKELGIEESIDHRSHYERGMKVIPTIHEGVSVAAMERKGESTKKRAENNARKAINERVKFLELEKVKTAKEEQLKVAAEREAHECERTKLEDARDQFLKQNKPYGTFMSEKTPNPVHNIIAAYGYQPVEHKDGSVFYHPRGKPSEVVFIAKENAIVVFDKSGKTIVEMLKLSSKKWPDGFELTGSEEFRARAEALAKEWGLGDKIKNPLPQVQKIEPAPKVEFVITPPPSPPIGEVMIVPLVAPPPAAKTSAEAPERGWREESDARRDIENLTEAELRVSPMVEEKDYRASLSVWWKERQRIFDEIGEEFDVMSEQKKREEKHKMLDKEISDSKERLRKLESGFIKFLNRKEIEQERAILDSLERDVTPLPPKFESKYLAVRRWKEWQDDAALEMAEQSADFKFPVERRTMKIYEAQKRERDEKAQKEADAMAAKLLHEKRERELAELAKNPPSPTRAVERKQEKTPPRKSISHGR